MSQVQRVPKSLTDYMWGSLGAHWKLNTLRKVIAKITTFDDVHKINRLIEEVFRHLWLLSANINEIEVSPSTLVEAALRCLLLEPLLYYRICDKILLLRGHNAATYPERVLMHDPFDDEDVEAQELRYQRCLQEYMMDFEQPPPREFWPDRLTQESLEPVAIVTTAMTIVQPMMLAPSVSIVTQLIPVVQPTTNRKAAPLRGSPAVAGKVASAPKPSGATPANTGVSSVLTGVQSQTSSSAASPYNAPAAHASTAVSNEPKTSISTARTGMEDAKKRKADSALPGLARERPVRRLFVQVQRGTKYEFHVNGTTQIYAVKKTLARLIRIAVERVRLIFNGQRHYDYSTLDECGIPDNFIAYVLLEQLGC